jgi:glycogen operon protein
VFRRRRFFSGKPVGRRGEAGLPDIAWFAPDGSEMTGEDWGTAFAKSVTVFLNGHGIPDTDTRGQRIVDDSFLLCFNAHDQEVTFTVPAGDYARQWTVELDTTSPTGTAERVVDPGDKVALSGRSIVILRKTL